MSHDISTCCGSFLYSAKFSWIINYNIREKATSAFLVHVHVAGFHVGPLLYLSWIGILRRWLLWRKENRRSLRKTLGARLEVTTYSTHICVYINFIKLIKSCKTSQYHIWYQVKIEPGPHWWEANTLTPGQFLLTAPSLLLLQINKIFFLKSNRLVKCK